MHRHARLKAPISLFSDTESKAESLTEAQFHTLLEENPDAIIIVGQDGCMSFASNRMEVMFGYRPDELQGKSVAILVPHQYRERHEGHMARFMKNPTPRMMGEGIELRALRKNGTEFSAEISLSPHPTLHGLVVVASIRDLEASKRLQHLLIRELHHRVKNMLATVLAITSQGLRSARNLEEGRLAVEARLLALGRAHDLLLQEASAVDKLGDLIRSAIEPFESDSVRRFIIRDMDIDIGPKVILPLSMLLNELCTNAVKYGALSSAMGHIEITAVVDKAAQRLKLLWTETGGPAVQKPTRASFGTRLINRVADQLRGSVTLKYETDGLVFELDIPLEIVQAQRVN
jgi:PAS domain S-box-containing protein